MDALMCAVPAGGVAELATDALVFVDASDGKSLEHLTYTDNVCDFAASKLVKVGTIKVSPSGSFSLTNHASAPVPDLLQLGNS